jgi:signal peptidase I
MNASGDNPARPRDQAALMARRKREWVILAILLALALLVTASIKRVEVNGISMEPSYFSGEKVFIWKTAPRSRLEPGDVIVFKSMDGDELIKRIFYIANSSTPASFPPPGFPREVSSPGGKYFGPDAPPNLTFQGYFDNVNTGAAPPPSRRNTIYVLGDNLMHSNDSRDFGPISPDQILGKVLP